MSNETMQDLNTQVLVGYTDKRGTAWHYRAGLQGEESNHYAGAIPQDDILRRLFAWKGEEAAVSATLADGRVVQDTGRKAIVRSDTGAILGIFRPGYRVHQYDEWLIRNLETLTDADLAIGSAGLLKGGGVAWVQVELAETMSVAGVEFRPFLTAATSMDGSLASTYQTGAQVVVCDNTLSTALGEKSHQIKVRHSKNSMGKVQDVRDALAIVHQVADDFEAQVLALTSREVSDAQWREFVREYTKPASESAHGLTISERREGELATLWNSDPRVKPWAGTAYGVVQAVNTHTHHMATVRGASRMARNMERMIQGEWDTVDAATLALLDKVQKVSA